MKRAARATVAQVCCARRKDGSVECDRKHCVAHAQREQRRKVLRATRRLFEAGHAPVVELGVGVQMAIDVIEPSLHHDPACQGAGGASGAGGAGGASGAGAPPPRLECMGRSVLHHLARKHNLSAEAAHAKVRAMGFELGDTLAAVARAAGWEAALEPSFAVLAKRCGPRASFPPESFVHAGSFASASTRAAPSCAASTSAAARATRPPPRRSWRRAAREAPRARPAARSPSGTSPSTRGCAGCVAARRPAAWARTPRARACSTGTRTTARTSCTSTSSGSTAR